MNDQAIFSALIRDFAALIGLDGLVADEDGRCGVVVEGAAPVILQYVAANETLVLYTVLGALPAEGRTTILEFCMAANLLWQGTAGATLGLDSADDSLVLARQFPVNQLEPGVLMDAVRQLSDTAMGWQRELADLTDRIAGIGTLPAALPGQQGQGTPLITWG